MKSNPNISYLMTFNPCSVKEKWERCYIYAPLTTLLVEHSFSNLYFIVDSLRCSLKIKTIGALMSIYFNNNKKSFPKQLF